MNTIYELPCRHPYDLQQTDTNQENPLDIDGLDALHAINAPLLMQEIMAIDDAHINVTRKKKNNKNC